MSAMNASPTPKRGLGRWIPEWVGTLAGSIFFGFGGLFMLLMPGTLSNSDTVAALIAIGIGAVGFPWAWHEYKTERERRIRPPTACRKCGYDLRGSPTAVCPECGENHAVYEYENGR